MYLCGSPSNSGDDQQNWDASCACSRTRVGHGRVRCWEFLYSILAPVFDHCNERFDNCSFCPLECGVCLKIIDTYTIIHLPNAVSRDFFTVSAVARSTSARLLFLLSTSTNDEAWSWGLRSQDRALALQSWRHSCVGCWSKLAFGGQCESWEERCLSV
jgi:hypothetical protein